MALPALPEFQERNRERRHSDAFNHNDRDAWVLSDDLEFMMRRRGIARALFAGLLAVVFLAQTVVLRCAEASKFVFAQSPSLLLAQNEARDVLDLQYPAGTRIVVVGDSFKEPKILSRGLFSAGAPVLSYDGAYLVFCGKAAPEAEWQIYEVRLSDQRRRVLTSMAGGAMHPALLPSGEMVFSAPVRRLTSPQAVRSLFSVVPGLKPHPLTFTTLDASDPTVLPDGRILFVGHRTSQGNRRGQYALLTINNDGTEVTEFAELQDSTTPFRRPRQLTGGRIGFLLATGEKFGPAGNAAFIQSSRPFHGAQPILPPEFRDLYAIEPAKQGLLVCVARAPGAGSDLRQPGVYQVEDGRPLPLAPRFCDPEWITLEAIEISSQQRPMGRLSNVEPTKGTGQILCLNAGFTSEPPGRSSATPVRVRVLVAATNEGTHLLGDIPLQPDGSFMAEVPADVALGFETLDSAGNILQRVDPGIWVRPGENRSCIGCHEPHNQAPRNIRPLAVRAPVPVLPLRVPGPDQPLVKR